MNAPPSAPNLWRERYETLRRHFVENHRVLAADPLGGVLFLRQGLGGWMRAWRACTEATPPTLTAVSAPWEPPSSTVGPQELTRLIADMTVPHLHLP
jgi:hypothetical protein